MKITGTEKYVYKNVPIPGGGYVTGFVFDEKNEGKLYLRTDIGGAYRYDKEAKVWKSLSDHVTMEDLRETYPIAIAKNNGKLYEVSGKWRHPNAKLSITSDEGESFIHVDLPFMAHGNLNGRGTGPKLAVSKQEEGTLYFASQINGLWKSIDDGANWTKCEAMKEEYLTFAAISPDGAKLIVGSAGVTTSRSERLRGRALYISCDGGESFSELWQPEDYEIAEVIFAGLVPQRCSFDEKYMYVTFQIMGPNAKNRELGYSCDNGSVWGGRIVRYDLTDYSATDITPFKCSKVIGLDEAASNIGNNPMDSGGTFGKKYEYIKAGKLDILPYGLAGVATCNLEPGLVVVSTLSNESGDRLYRSRDYGETWECILHDLDTGVMDFRTEYMKPKYNGGHNLIHWMTDLKINPFNQNELWFNTGTGPFVTHNLLADEVHFEDYADGIEETVHINSYSFHEGPVQLLDIVGDLGGFAFEDLDKPCDNSFADEKGNRYITCLNADYSDEDPYKVIVTARGNWTGKTEGGLIYSKDQGRTFSHINQPFGLTEKIDVLLKRIQKPNVNSGWVSLSPNGENIVWSISDDVYLPADCVVVSHDGGKSFVKANIYNKAGDCISNMVVPEGKRVLGEMFDWRGTGLAKMPDLAAGFKSFSDRKNNSYFYGFGQFGEFYVSTDGGYNFYEKQLPVDGYGSVNFALVDCINKTEIRALRDTSGVFYLALGAEGMWKLEADAKGGTVELKKLSGEGDCVFRLGLGAKNSIYISATVNGQYGFYRTEDEGKTAIRINDSHQMFGEINSMCGDGRKYQRVYVATGSRGILYGEPVKS